MAKILDGKLAAKEIRSQVKDEIDIKRPLHGQPCLAVVLSSEDPASKLYVRKKREACEEVGITSFLVKPFEGGTDQWTDPYHHLMSTIQYLNDDCAVHGILVQLPLPASLKQYQYDVFDAINPMKDVDVFSPTNVGLLSQGRPRFIPCTPQGIQELLTRFNVEISGKQVCVISRSDIVGKPLSALLIQDDGNKANATVVTCHDRTPPELLKQVCLTSDIIVVAVGQPNFLTPDLVQEGAVVVDVGINRLELTNKIVGDVDPLVYDKVYAYTPVPGGCGPMTICGLLKNTIKAFEMQKNT